jgi:hypothetical protein
MPMSPFLAKPTPKPQPITNVQPACPLCNGEMIPVRDLVRCCVCGFTTCAGCQGDTAEGCCETQ